MTKRQRKSEICCLLSMAVYEKSSIAPSAGLSDTEPPPPKHLAIGRLLASPGPWAVLAGRDPRSAPPTRPGAITARWGLGVGGLATADSARSPSQTALTLGKPGRRLWHEEYHHGGVGVG